MDSLLEEESWNDFFTELKQIDNNNNNKSQNTNNIQSNISLNPTLTPNLNSTQEQTKQQNKEIINIDEELCPNCETPWTSCDYIDTCINCGIVADISPISSKPDWNNFSDESGTKKNNERCGAVSDPTNPYDNAGGLYVPKYMWMKSYNEEGKPYYYNLSKIAIRTSYSSKQRAFDEGKYSFQSVTHTLGLNDNVIASAKFLWGAILKTDILKRGGNRRGLKACCIFYACLMSKYPRSREEIAVAFEIDGTTDFTKGEKIFREIFENNQEFSSLLYLDSDNTNMYLRYVSDLGLPFQINKVMIQIKRDLAEHIQGIAAKSEIGGLLYYTVKELFQLKTPNKNTICKHINICSPTLNKVVEIIKYYYSKHPEKHANILKLKC